MRLLVLTTYISLYFTLASFLHACTHVLVKKPSNYRSLQLLYYEYVVYIYRAALQVTILRPAYDRTVMHVPVYERPIRIKRKSRTLSPAMIM